MWNKLNPKLILGIITIALLVGTLISFGFDIYRNLNYDFSCNPGVLAVVPNSYCYGLFKQMLLDNSPVIALFVAFITSGVGWLLAGRWRTSLQKILGFCITIIIVIGLFIVVKAVGQLIT